MPGAIDKQGAVLGRPVQIGGVRKRDDAVMAAVNDKHRCRIVFDGVEIVKWIPHEKPGHQKF